MHGGCPAYGDTHKTSHHSCHSMHIYSYTCMYPSGPCTSPCITWPWNNALHIHQHLANHGQKKHYHKAETRTLLLQGRVHDSHAASTFKRTLLKQAYRCSADTTHRRSTRWFQVKDVCSLPHTRTVHFLSDKDGQMWRAMGCLLSRLFTPRDETLWLLLLQRPCV